MLLLMAIEIIFGAQISRRNDRNVAWIIIATPTLTGADVMSTAILLASQYGYLFTIMAGIPALLITWVLFRNLGAILRMLGTNIIRIISKVIGLFIAAMAVEFIMRGHRFRDQHGRHRHTTGFI